MGTLVDIVQRFPAMILALNEKAEVVLCNQWFKDVSGYVEEQIVGKQDALKALFGEDSRFEQLLESTLKAGESFTEDFSDMQMRCSDGSQKYIQLILRQRKEQPLAPELRTWLIGFDRTEEHLLKVQLEESSARYESISRATNDAVWDWDVQANTLWWGEGISKLFGYPKGGKATEFNWWVERIHPEDREKVVRSLLNAARNAERSWSSEYRFLRTDGTYAHVLDKGSSIFDKNGRVIRMIGGMLDISEKWIYEHSLMIKNQQLAEYAFFNSHKVRAPLSRLLACVELMNNIRVEDADLVQLLDSVKESATELDREIKEINKLISTDVRTGRDRKV